MESKYHREMYQSLDEKNGLLFRSTKNSLVSQCQFSVPAVCSTQSVLYREILLVFFHERVTQKNVEKVQKPVIWCEDRFKWNERGGAPNSSC